MHTERSNRRRGYTSSDVFRFAARYWVRQPVRFKIILALVALSAFVETNLPNALSAFFEAIRTHAAQNQIILRLTIFVGAFLASSLLSNTMYRIYNVFENKIFKFLLDDAFAHVQSLSEQFFVNTFAGSIITMIKRGRDRIETYEDQILLRFFPTALILAYSIILLAPRFPVLAALLATYLLVVVSISAILVVRFAGPAQEAYANAQDLYGAHLSDTITGIVTTKSYAQESREIAGFNKLTSFLHDKNLEAYLRGNTTSLVQRLLLGGMLALLLGGGTWYYLHGLATIDDMAYLVMAYTILQSHIREIGDNIKSLLTASYDLHGVIALMNEQPSVKDCPGATALNVSKGAITFDSVGFRYPSKDADIFESLSIAIRPGERVALVGRSGSGKTTFVRLVQRLYDVNEGSIYIDGQAISEVTQASLRGAIAVVPQEPILFHRSLRENIGYGKPDATMNDIRAAARQAHIDDFIMSLPQQYETLVGERGIKLSGGERQRVAIARAILSDRKILILDEATSSLDSASEAAIQEAIYAVTHGRTSIIIAHRLSTIRDADRIVVFENGKIIEEGKHEELVQKAVSIYADFYRMQAGGFIDPDVCCSSDVTEETAIASLDSSNF